MILSLVAAAVLTGSEPSAAALADRFVQVQQALPGEQPTATGYEGWTKAQLHTELRRLEDARPGLGGPISLMAIGAAIGIVDLVVVLFGGFIVLVSGTRFDTGVIVAMAVFGVIAAGLLIVGGILLKGISTERREYGAQIDLIKTALEAMAPAPVEPPPNVPPAMPFPQQVMGPSPLIAVTLARF